METLGELKSMVSTYARQETVEPLKALGKWVAIGLAGAALIVVGVLFLALGVLRLLQSELDTFDNNLSFLPYLIACAVLAAAAGLAGWAAVRTFDDDRSR